MTDETVPKASGELTIIDLLNGLKVKELFALVAGLFVLLGGAFTLGGLIIDNVDLRAARAESDLKSVQVSNLTKQLESANAKVVDFRKISDDKDASIARREKELSTVKGQLSFWTEKPSLNVNQAMWGAGNNWYDVTDDVKAACNTKFSCSVPANNTGLPSIRDKPDPWSGVHKILRVQYDCGHIAGSVNNVVADDANSAFMKCE